MQRKESDRWLSQQGLRGLSGSNRSRPHPEFFRRTLNDSLPLATDRGTHPQDSLSEPRCSKLGRSDEPSKHRALLTGQVYSGTIPSVCSALLFHSPLSSDSGLNFLQTANRSEER